MMLVKVIWKENTWHQYIHEDVSENPTSILFHPPQSHLLLSISLAVKLLSLRNYIMTIMGLTVNIGINQLPRTASFNL